MQTGIDNLDDLYLVKEALFAYRRDQERKLRALRKSAGGRNYRANEEQQEATEKRIAQASELIGTVADAHRAEARAYAERLGLVGKEAAR